MTRFVIVCGATECGKTHWVREHIYRRRRVIALDPTAELTEKDPQRWAVANGWRDCMRAVVWLAEHRPPRYRLACRMPVEPGDQADEWLRALWAIRERRGAPFTLVVDEADLLTETGKTSGLNYVLQIGRRMCEQTILVAQRLTALPPRARTNAGLFVQFATSEARDFEELRGRFGKKAERAVRRLQPRQHLKFGRDSRWRADD